MVNRSFRSQIEQMTSKRVKNKPLDSSRNKSKKLILSISSIEGPEMEKITWKISLIGSEASRACSLFKSRHNKGIWKRAQSKSYASDHHWAFSKITKGKLIPGLQFWLPSNNGRIIQTACCTLQGFIRPLRCCSSNTHPLANLFSLFWTHLGRTEIGAKSSPC